MIIHFFSNLRSSILLVLFFVSLFVLQGCVTVTKDVNKNGRFINKLVLTNKTDRELRNVKLKDLDNNHLLSCNIILPKASCSIGFKKVLLEKHSTVLTWLERSQTYSHAVKADNTFQGQEIKTVHLDIYERGQINTYFK